MGGKCLFFSFYLFSGDFLSLAIKKKMRRRRRSKKIEHLLFLFFSAAHAPPLPHKSVFSHIMRLRAYFSENGKKNSKFEKSF